MTEQISIFKNAKAEESFMASYDKYLKLWPFPIETTYIPTKFGDAHVITGGVNDGIPLVLLPGASATSGMWFRIAEKLGTKFRIYAVDILSDVGKSKMHTQTKTRQDIADWLAEVITGLGINKPHLMGHSYGGFFTANFASSYPEMVDKIALLAPAGIFYNLPLKFWIQALSTMLFPFKFRFEGFNKYLNAKGFEGHTLEEQEIFYLSMKGQKGVPSPMAWRWKDEEVSSIKNPTLLLVGDQEVIYNGQKALNRARRLMPNIETELVQNCGHEITTEKPDFVCKRVMRFLSYSE